MRVKWLFFVLVICCWSASTAQSFQGLQTSNYAGVTGALSNPANIVDNRYKVDVALTGLDLTVGNNYAGIKRSSLAYKGNLFSQPDFYNWNPNVFKNLVINNNRYDKAGYFSMRYQLPSFLITLSKKDAVALNLSVRSMFNVSGVSQQLIDFFYYDFGNTGMFNKTLENKHLSLQQMTWAEAGLTYARVIKLEGPHFIKVGVTPKLLFGLEAAYAYIDNLQYKVSTKDTFSFFKSEVGYGHSDNFDAIGNSNASFFKPTAYPGFGGDVGVVYEWRPEVDKYKYDMDGKTGLWRRDKNKYKLKAGLSIIDIGGIKYRKGGQSGDFVADVTRFNINDLAAASTGKLDSLLMSKFKRVETKQTFFMMLPTAVNLLVDYHLWKPFYVSYSANLTNFFPNRESKVNEYTTMSLAPRFDHKWFGLTVPINFQTLAMQRGQPVTIGTMLRLGPLVVGTNDILSFTSTDIYGASVYFLLKVPIPYGYLKDKDGDKVSNKHDLCKDVPGVWEFKGCPDTDGDHVEDKLDKCPTIPGLMHLEGCPDRDNDSITDALDMCPDSAGLRKFNGCPDRDNDGWMDRKDSCPDIPGLEQFYGCPDKDNDGVQDKYDACPDEPGLKALNGCPDRDGDGITDQRDKCPDQRGEARYSGCPDTDNDGLPDPDDKCPTVSGPAENVGCPWPDTDRDGVLDKDDYCPKDSGDVKLGGCPRPPDPIAQDVPMKPAEKKIIEKAFATLEFATGKDVIKPKSLPALMELAKLLKQHEDWQLKLGGHTDNAGAPQANMELSEKRAKAVANYLMKQGVVPEKLIVEWFGQDKPIADNATAAGRQKNRRVEMKILLKE